MLPLVRPEGLEPPTLCLEGRRSVPLSYGRPLLKGAEDGNRTRMTGLEGQYSTIELLPPIAHPGRRGRIRTGDLSVPNAARCLAAPLSAPVYSNRRLGGLQQQSLGD